MSITLINGTVVTLEKENRVLANHDVTIDNGVIVSLGPTSTNASCPPNTETGKVIDARGKIILPGFVNAHMHFYSSFARGFSKLAPAKDFQEVLKTLWWRLDKQLTLDDCRVSAQLALIDAIRKGTTTIIDHHASPNAVTGSLHEIANATENAGIRACLAYEVSDRDGEKIRDAGIAENIAFIQDTQARKNPLIRGLFGLHASFTLSDQTLSLIAKKTASLDTGFHIHCGEAKSDQVDCQRKYQTPVVNRLHRFDITGKQSIFAHGTHLSPEEIRVLQATDTMLVHNPQSNLNNAVGIADIISLMTHGILVGLGTDAMTNNMLEELRCALFLQKLAQDNPSAAFNECIKMFLTNNYVIAGRLWSDTQWGSIAPGQAADLILFDYNPPTPFDTTTFYGHLMFGLSQSIVDTTIVNGKVLMENRQLQTIDESAVFQEARELSARLWQRF